MRRLLLLLGAAACANAQIENCSTYRDTIDDIVHGGDSAVKLVDLGQTARCFVSFAAGDSSQTYLESAAFDVFVKMFEASRTDQQAGNSVIAQGAVAQALSIGLDYGAFTQSTAGQTITVRGNLAGLPSALVRSDLFPYCIGGESQNALCLGRSFLSALRRVSFGVSLDTTRAESRASTVSGRIELWNRRDVTSSSFQQQWHAKAGVAMDRSTQALLDKAGALVADIESLPTYDDWRSLSLSRIRAAGRDRGQLVSALTASLLDLTSRLTIALPDYRQRALNAGASYNGYFIDQDDFVDSLALKNVVALEFTNNRPLGQPSISNWRLIFDLPISARTKFVANAAVDLYDSVSSGMERLRDIQAGIEFDHGLGGTSIASPATLSFAGYFQRQNANLLVNVDPGNPISGVSFAGLPSGAGNALVNAGNIWLVQTRLTLAPPQAPIRFPISVTYSNRTELVNGPRWSAQVGLTYNFDSLLSSLGKK